MRLLNTQTLQVESFVDAPPCYAILSHTWNGDDEVSFQEWHDPAARGAKSGYQKILGACRLAAADGLAHVWIDTMCIDKTSSSELSEAINSMFSWYEEATVCYAYL